MKKRTNLICNADYSHCVVYFGSFPVTKVCDCGSLFRFLETFIDINSDLKFSDCDYPFECSSVRRTSCSVLSFMLGVDSPCVPHLFYDVFQLNYVYVLNDGVVALELLADGHKFLLTSAHLVYDFDPFDIVGKDKVFKLWS